MTRIIAHRGASGLVPFENTMDAFEKAIEIGAPMMEFDVRRTRDGVLVCFHDAHVQQAPLASMTYEELLERTRALGFEAPRLRDVLEACRGRIAFDIEIKEGGYEDQIVGVICDTISPSDCIIKSFDDATVLRVKELNEHLCVGLLLGVDKPERALRTRLGEIYPELRLSACRADFVSPNHKLLKMGFVRRMHRLGYEVLVWTVDDPALMAALIRAGVDGLITNRPDLGLGQLRAAG